MTEVDMLLKDKKILLYKDFLYSISHYELIIRYAVILVKILLFKEG
jgi:hypothetical protein